MAPMSAPAVTTDHFLLDRLDEIWNLYGDDKKGKGTAFEQLIASYLRTAPEYADRFAEVYLWQDWPERGNLGDHGIDLVAKDLHTGGWCAIQCKFYEPTHHMAKKDIDSFIAASASSRFTSRMLFSTAKDWGPTVEQQLEHLSVPITRIGVNDLLESKVDWHTIDWKNPPQFLPTTGKKTLRPHQKDAKDRVLAGFTEHDRGQLIMACGTGKTFTALKIAEQVATDRKAEPTTVLFLVPSIQLLNQTLREWKQESEIPFRAFAVCSDTKVGKNAEDIGVHDLIYPATTDTKALARQIRERTDDDQFTVVFSTYQSIDVVAQAQRDGMPDFDLVISDEAHRTTGVTLAGEDDSAFVRVHDNDYIRGSKRLYMTATPRLFNPDTKDKAKENDAVLASMDDPAVFGPVLHRLGFGEAVEKDLLTDYKVLVFKVDQKKVASEFGADISGMKLDDAAKLVGCWNGLAKRFAAGELDAEADEDLSPMRTAVAFAGNIPASKAVADVFPRIVDRLVSTHGEEEGEGNDLRVDVRHVDGTMNALERGTDLQWLKAGSQKTEGCRILTNVKCLSEGVDVPSLDAVLFLSPRASQVDIVQSVGRVMRKDPSGRKKVGYIILPVVVNGDEPPEQALADNKRFQTVWQVLQALRAHDDRFNAMINQLDLNTKKDTTVRIFDATEETQRTDENKDTPGKEDKGTEKAQAQQLTLPFGLEDWRDAIYARIVKKVGERRYWETWAKDIAEIAKQHITRINGLLSDPQSAPSQEFDAFLSGLRGNLNDGIGRDEAIEMLAQHLITRPVFEALFAGYDFAKSNPVAQTMERMLAVLDEHSLEDENESLQQFYASVRARVEGVDNAEGRQKIIVELYDKFFATAFKKTVDKLGIVYTPVEIVDFILRSADEVLHEHFGQRLTDEGVHILDGFTGTGTFMTRLLQLGLIEPHDLARKYANELHANEILLLAYYIAAVNIETTYQDVRRGGLDEGASEYEPFPGLVLTDTFQSYEDGDDDDLGVFPENNERINRQRKLPVTVLVGNPPYSVGQESANQDNANDKYPSLDAAIRDTYGRGSAAKLLRNLYDSYVRALMWASLRIGDRGVIGFVTNGGWLDSNSFDAMRKTVAKEFDWIYVYNLRGNQRTSGEESRREGGKIFGSGSRASVTIVIFVRCDRSSTEAEIRYADIGEYLTREQKLALISNARSVIGLDCSTITPDDNGDWINQGNALFAKFTPASSIFIESSPGTSTGRDSWVYSASASAAIRNARLMATTFNHLLESGATSRGSLSDSKQISWSDGLERRLQRRMRISIEDIHAEAAAYRPFERMRLVTTDGMLERPGALRFFPDGTTNACIYITGPSAGTPFAALVVDAAPNFHTLSSGQAWPRRLPAAVITDGLPGDAVHIDEVDNISDEALVRFRSAYGEEITKDDVFHYVYGLLHSPEYRDRFAADLKKSLPRIPLVTDARPYIDAGERLMELHLGYESVDTYPLDGLDVEPPQGADRYAFYAVGDKKMRFGKPTGAQKAEGLKKDRTVIHYNDRITLSGIPEAAYRYMLGSRSAIEWIIDRYHVKTDKASGIVNDPNDWSRGVSDPRYIIDLLARIVTVSLETMAIVDSLPTLEIREDQG